MSPNPDRSRQQLFVPETTVMENTPAKCPVIGLQQARETSQTGAA